MDENEEASGSAPNRPLWRRTGVIVGAVIVILVVVAGVVVATVSGGDDEPAQAAPSSALPTPLAAPMELGEPVRWTESSSRVLTDQVPAAADGLAMTRTASTVSIVDLATGRPKWTIDGESPLHLANGTATTARYWDSGLLVGQGEELGVVVEYADFSSGADFGVMLLSAADGSVRWQQSVLKDDSPDGPGISLKTADSSLTVVQLGLPGQQEPTIVAFNTRTGERYWQYTGLEATTLSGYSVVGAVKAGWVTNQTSGDTVAGIDMLTGAAKWTYTEAKYATIREAAGGRVLVETKEDAEEFDATLFVLNADTGAVEAVFGRDQWQNCAATAALIACSTGRELVTYRQETGDIVRIGLERRAREQPEGFGTVETIWGDHIVVKNTNRYFVYDWAGTVVGVDLPGRPLAFDGRFAVFGRENVKPGGRYTYLSYPYSV